MTSNEQSRLNRRDLVKFISVAGAAAVATESVFVQSAKAAFAPPLKLKPLEPQRLDQFVVADGFQSYPVLSWGDPITTKLKFGFNNDFITWIRPDHFAQNQVMIWVNHEDLDPLMVSGYKGAGPKSAEQLLEEMSAVGGSSVRLQKVHGRWLMIPDDRWNERLDGNTMIPFSSDLEILSESHARGTLANCSGGKTPWNTILSCEENFDEFYGDRTMLSGASSNVEDPMQWRGAASCPPEHYGWVVEYDPIQKSARKLISLGRFRHEGALVVKSNDGRCVVYMGEDVAGGCIYKFVADRPGSLEQGVLYVADIANSRWIALLREEHEILREKFPDDLSVLIYAAEAAKLVGGTPMDRPEGIAMHPASGGIFVALTNNAKVQNFFGSILKIEEGGDGFVGTSFAANTFLTGGPSAMFACPDNLCFDRRGNMWFASDISEKYMNKAEMEPFGNNGLFYVPMSGADAGKVFQIASAPNDAELTGLSFLDDGETLLLSVQHPGKRTTDLSNPTSTWNLSQTGIPRSAVMALHGPMMRELLSA